MLTTLVKRNLFHCPLQKTLTESSVYSRLIERTQRLVAVTPTLTLALETATAAALLQGHAGKVSHVERLEHVHGVTVNLDGLHRERGLVGDEVHAALTLLLLKLEGDAAHGATLDALHKVLRERDERKGRGQVDARGTTQALYRGDCWTRKKAARWLPVTRANSPRDATNRPPRHVHELITRVSRHRHDRRLRMHRVDARVDGTFRG